MWRHGIWQAIRFVASLIGAVLLNCVLAGLSHHVHGVWPMLHAVSGAVANAVRGNFGNSSVTGITAVRAVEAVLASTLQLLCAGAVIALIVGLPVGAFLSASRTLRAAAPLMQIIAAAPVFCAALGLIWFSVRVLHWNEPSATGTPAWRAMTSPTAWNGAMQAFLLAALTVGVAGAACVQLSLRRTAASALNEPYRAGLRMMGLGALEIDLRYIVPAFAAALLRSLGEIVLALLAAAAVAEWVFHRDGAAVLFLKSVALGDWNVAAVVLLVFACVKLAADFIGSIAAKLIVPEEL